MRGLQVVGSVLTSSALLVPGVTLGQTPPPPVAPKQPAARNPIQTTSLDKKAEDKGLVLASVLARVNGQPILAEEVMNAASYRLPTSSRSPRKPR